MSVKIAISPWYMAAIVKKRKKLVIAELNLIWLLPWLNSALPATLKGLFALHSTALLKSGVNHAKLRYVNIQNQSQFALTLSLSLSLSLSLFVFFPHTYIVLSWIDIPRCASYCSIIVGWITHALGCATVCVALQLPDSSYFSVVHKQWSSKDVDKDITKDKKYCFQTKS